jgi:hypothetical protein
VSIVFWSLFMTETRRHRGAHPRDGFYFSGTQATLRNAVRDYSLLLTRGYGEKAALNLVGDRYALHGRQRLAVRRSSCSDAQRTQRRRSRRPLDAVRGQAVALDGFNVLITLEAALSGAFLFLGRDGCLRDLSGVHGTYRRVDETVAAASLIGTVLSVHGIADVHWYLDRPVSNSGRLKALLLRAAEKKRWPWSVTLIPQPDALLSQSGLVVASSDSVILDTCAVWINLVREILERHTPNQRTRIIDLHRDV